MQMGFHGLGDADGVDTRAATKMKVGVAGCWVGEEQEDLGQQRGELQGPREEDLGAAGEMGLRVPTQGGFEQRRRGRAGDEFSAGGRGFGGAAPERENLGERKIG